MFSGILNGLSLRKVEYEVTSYLNFIIKISLSNLAYNTEYIKLEIGWFDFLLDSSSASSCVLRL